MADAGERPTATLLLTGISELVTPRTVGAVTSDDLMRVEDAVVVVSGERIAWVGTRVELAGAGELPVVIDESVEVVDLGGRAVTPGLVDSHTHLLFGGRRHGDFAARCRGKTYQEIAQAGGGIRYTVEQTRQASDEELFDRGNRYLAGMLRLGTTTVEAKSGYGLVHDHELRMLRILGELDRAQPIDIVRTWLGAHELPRDRDRRAYIDEMTQHTLPVVVSEELARFADCFCERGVYTVAEADEILRASAAAGLRLTLHAEQLHHSGGAAMAAGLGATSVSHLEHATPDDLDSLAAAGTIPQFLPACVFFLGRGPYPPARAALDRGMSVALATDFNPGSAMTYNLPLVMTIACTQMAMTPEESLAAATLGGARALGLEDRGCLAPGLLADLLVVDSPYWLDLVYHFGETQTYSVFKRGHMAVGPP